MSATVGCADRGKPAPLLYAVKDPATGDWCAGTYPQQVVVLLDESGWGQVAGLTAFLSGVPVE